MDGLNNYKIGLLSGMEPVRALVVPLGWNCDVEEPNFNSTARSILYFPSAAPDAVLTFYNRGFPVDSGETDKLRELLSQEPKELGVAKVKETLPQIVGNLADASAFDMTKAETVDLNGKRTLMIEGFWITSAKKFHGYFLPGDIAGGFIQEIFFEGSEPNFSKYLAAAQKAIKSVKWSQ